MIHAISAANRQLYEDVIAQHFRVRQDGPRLDAVGRANLCGLAAAQHKIA